MLAASLLITGLLPLPSAELSEQFLNPPREARPRTLWMWMNGNVSADGITRDLEAMRRVGLGGALVFNIGEYIPKGPVDYGSQQWIELMVHAAREADRLGLDLAMHNCPGWSSSGGPWITPEMSMQQLVWTETQVQGPSSSGVQLRQPFTRLNYYRDVRVLAFPTLPGEERSFAEFVSTVTNAGGDQVDLSLLTDEDLSTSVTAGPDNPLVFAMKEPFEARALTLFYTSGGSTIGFALESSDDGLNFTNIARLTPASPRAIGDASHNASFEPVRARYFRLRPNRNRGVTEFRLHNAARIPDWNYKANFAFRSAQPDEPPPQIDPQFVIDPARVLDLTAHVNENGQLNYNLPAGSWTILRFGHTARGQENIAAPDAGVGLESDKLSRVATRFHFEHGIGPLMRALGLLAGKSFTALEVDSYEVGVQNWTEGFENAFEERNGYSMIRYLPAMTGRCVGDAQISERFLWDLRRTHADMLADNYYGELRALCYQHGMRLYVEPYGAGPGPYDELQIAGRADFPMGEFWAHFPWDDIPSLKLAASAAHTRGGAIVAGEAFTSTEEQSRFLDHPYGLKTTGDLAFSFGLNRMLFHRFAHQPHPTAAPGMTMGPWGFNYDRNNTWFEKSGPWIDYLSRAQFLLQQGQFVADVLYFTGEGAPRISKRMSPDLPPGYAFDAVDAEVLRQAEVEQGAIRLQGGASYRVLVLDAGVRSMTVELARKLETLVRGGAVVVGKKPQFSPSLKNYSESDRELRRIVDSLWGMQTSAEQGNQSRSRGEVVQTDDLSQVLTRLGIQPDFEYSSANSDADLVWLHRRAEDADIYFVANRQRRSEDVLCTFRVSGRRPELWRPESGEIIDQPVYAIRDERTTVPMRLGPAESVFVVFRSPAEAQSIRSVAHNEQVVLSADSVVGGIKPPPAELQNTFSVVAWIKPESDMTTMPQEDPGNRVDENGKSWLVPAPVVESEYGSGHAGMGIAAARNGVFVAERTAQGASAVLVSRKPLSGWTHIAMVYREGRPVLYLNGEREREGRASGLNVRPGVGFPPPPRGWIYHFDGEVAGRQLFDRALEEAEIKTMFARGIPAPELPGPIEVEGRQAGEVRARVWQPGGFSLNDGRTLSVTNLPAPVEIQSLWNVTFDGLAAPGAIQLTNLVSLRKHPDAAVRHFSGTVVYRTTFELERNPSPNQEIWLDAGRVEVIADVRVNGRETGVVWKPPYRVEITDAVRPGRNELEIRVTTLLVNRLIGDEQLPIENEYNPRNRAILALPDWYREGRPKPSGGRATFSTWKFFGRDDPLVESGLLGPVRVLTSTRAVFEPLPK